MASAPGRQSHSDRPQAGPRSECCHSAQQLTVRSSQETRGHRQVELGAGLTLQTWSFLHLVSFPSWPGLQGPSSPAPSFLGTFYRPHLRTSRVSRDSTTPYKLRKQKSQEFHPFPSGHSPSLRPQRPELKLHHIHSITVRVAASFQVREGWPVPAGPSLLTGTSSFTVTTNPRGGRYFTAHVQRG